MRNARSANGSHHLTYEFVLPDGGVLRTRISHPPDRSTYGPNLWSHILRDQLDVDEATFWACVNKGEPPRRGVVVPKREALPAGLVSVLLHQVGLGEAEVAGMTKDVAIRRVNEYWTTGA